MSNISPTVLRVGAIAAAIGAIGLFAYFLTGNDEVAQRSEVPRPIEHILTDGNTRQVTVETLAARNEDLEREVAGLRGTLERVSIQQQRALEQVTVVLGSQIRAGDRRGERAMGDLLRRVAELQAMGAGNADVTAALDALEHELQDEPALEERREEPGEIAPDEPAAAPEPPRAVVAPREEPRAPERESGVARNLDPDALFQRFTPVNLPVAGASTPGVGPNAAPVVGGPAAGGRVRLIEAAADAAETGPVRTDETFYLPSGSILTGTLITGLDAPTGAGAGDDPVPVLLRLQHEAILPNHFNADVRECFLLVSGYGDLSSERVYLRGETLSCVRTDGGVIEAELAGFVAGEDGRAGMRGRVVSKQGQLIGAAVIAGFLEGLSDALDDTDSVTFGLDDNDRFALADVDRTAQGAALQGAGRAAEAVSEFYLDQAQRLFPVIEIPAGRQVDVILTSGMRLPRVDG